MEDLDTFLTLLYVMVDDLCKQHGLSMPTPPGSAPKLSLSELITLALFGQWARFPSERAFYRFAQRHLKAAFPMLPDHSQFVRGEHACAQLIEQMACLLASLRPCQVEDLYQILDATGVPVRCIKRRGEGWLAGVADKGWYNCISSYMGFHVLLAITPSGFVTGFGFSPASVHDTRLAEPFLGLRQHPSDRLSSVGHAFPTYVADPGFASEPFGLPWLFRREGTGKLVMQLFKFHWTHILEGGMTTNPIVNLSARPRAINAARRRLVMRA